MADKLKRMVGFRNIAVHDLVVIEKHLDEFLQYSKAVLLKDATNSRQRE